MITFIENLPKQADDTSMDDYYYTKTKYSILKEILKEFDKKDITLYEDGVMNFYYDGIEYEFLFFPFEETDFGDGRLTFGTIYEDGEATVYINEPEEILNFLKELN